MSDPRDLSGCEDLCDVGHVSSNDRAACVVALSGRVIRSQSAARVVVGDMGEDGALMVAAVGPDVVATARRGPGEKAWSVDGIERMKGRRTVSRVTEQLFTAALSVLAEREP